jgi:hypothetical protein
MPGRIRMLIGKLIRLRPREWVDLLRAQAALLVAQFVVWTRPHGSLVSRHSVPSAPTRTPVRAAPRAEALARAIHRAAHYGLTRPGCLVRSIALKRLLSSSGFDAVVRVGVRQRNGSFDAHAWVELDGAVLGDHESHTESFTELSDLHIAEKGR